MFSKLTKFFDLINRLLFNIDARTAESIKRGFFFLVFLGVLAGIFIGYRMGKESATIQSDPMFRDTNDSFELEMKREREEGNFRDMATSEHVIESDQNESEMIPYPSKERMEPEVEEGIIESERKERKGIISSSSTEEPIIEGEYRTRGRNKTDVDPLDRKAPSENKSAEPILDQDSTIIRPNTGGTSATTTRKRTGKDIRSVKRIQPQPIQDNTGIIGN